MKYFQRILFVVAILSLAACSSMRHSANGTASATGEGGGAYTQGLDNQSGISSTTMGNSLVPGANQTYHFAFDSYSIQSQDMDSIKVQANYLLANAHRRVRLEGNTDERGSREYNVALGWRRAKAVASALRQEGVAPSQIVTISYGEEHPVALCHNESCWGKNRRTDLVYEVK